MTDTTINDAICWPQDEGTGVTDGNEDFTSAAGFQLLSKYKGEGSYVGEDTAGNATLQFNDVDTSNEQVDVGTGYAYIDEASHTLQSGSQTSYDTTLPVNTPYLVILPSEVVNLQLGTDNVNDLWLAVDPANNDDVFIRHGNGLSAPTEPNVKLGTVDTSTGDTTRANDLATTSFDSVSADDLDIASTDLISTGTYHPIVTFSGSTGTVSTSSGSYVDADARGTLDYDTVVPGNAQLAVYTGIQVFNADGDVELRNNSDNEQVHEITNFQGTTIIGPTNYTPATKSGGTRFLVRIRSSDGTSTTKLNTDTVTFGLQY